MAYSGSTVTPSGLADSESNQSPPHSASNVTVGTPVHSAGTNGNPGLLAGRPAHGTRAKHPATALLRPFGPFSFFRGVRRPVALVAGARGFFVCAGEAGPGAGRTAAAHA